MRRSVIFTHTVSSSIITDISMYDKSIVTPPAIVLTNTFSGTTATASHNTGLSNGIYTVKSTDNNSLISVFDAVTVWNIVSFTPSSLTANINIPNNTFKLTTTHALPISATFKLVDPANNML